MHPTVPDFGNLIRCVNSGKLMVAGLLCEHAGNFFGEPPKFDSILLLLKGRDLNGK
jgi:hypothetical protein